MMTGEKRDISEASLTLGIKIQTVGYKKQTFLQIQSLLKDYILFYFLLCCEKNLFAMLAKDYSA